MRVKQKEYEFTLVIRGVDEDTPDLEDSLYEAGCDDALINFRNGTVYLDFVRQANSLEDAVMSAIKDVESATIKPVVVSIAPEDIVTESEIANRLSISRQTVSLWIKGERRQSFPRPVMKLASKSPFWKWREIIEWVVENKVMKSVTEEEVNNARFLERMNYVFEGRDELDKNARVGLYQRLQAESSNKYHNTK